MKRDPYTEEMEAWQALDAFFMEHEGRYKLSFGLEYSCVIDYAASIDVTPRRGHPKAREYPLWQAAGGTRAAAIRNVLETARTALEEHAEAGYPMADDPARRSEEQGARAEGAENKP